jgi:hypothetical protein
MSDKDPGKGGIRSTGDSEPEEDKIGSTDDSNPEKFFRGVDTDLM